MFTRSVRAALPAAVRRLGRGLAALFLALSGLVACAPSESPPRVVHDRFIDVSDPLLFDGGTLFDDEEVITWTPTTDAAWTHQGEVEIAGDVLRLDPGGTLELHGVVDLQASEVDAIEIELRGAAHKLELAWSHHASGPMPTNEERRVEVDPRLVDGSSIRIDLAARPGWHSRIRSLYLRVSLQKRLGGTELGQVRALRFELAEDRFASAVGSAWRVDLGGDARIARIAPPGLDLVGEMNAAGADPLLSLAYGLEPGMRNDVEFVAEIRAAGDARNDARNDAEWTEILRRQLKAEDSGRWRHAELALGDTLSAVGVSDDGRMELRLRTEGTEGTIDPAHGLPVWGHPEVLVRDDLQHDDLQRNGSPAPNVALVVLDTLRADQLGSYGNDAAVSPFLDAWAAERAVRFETVVAPAPWTLPSHASLFTGLDAVRHGANHNQGLPPSYTLLAEELRAAGYTTVAITGGGFLRPHFGLDQGFDRFVYWPGTLSEHEIDEGLERALEFLEREGNRRFFLFFHTYEVHYPHRRRPAYAELAGARAERDRGIQIGMEPAGYEDDILARWERMVVRRPGDEEYQAGLRPEEKELVLDLYGSAIHYADEHVQRLFAALDEEAEESGRPTARIVTSDHGEALAQDPNDRAGHLYLEDYNLLVPWLMELPDEDLGALTVRRQVRSVDLPVTLLDYLEPWLDGEPFAAKNGGADGVSLLGLLRRLARRGPEAELEAPAVTGPQSRAWSYSANSNRGISLRWDDRKYILNDNAWSRVDPRERLRHLETAPAAGEGRRAAETASDEAAQSLDAPRRLALEHLAQKPGLRLRLTHRSGAGGRLEGRIHSRTPLLTTAKLLSLPARLENNQRPRFSLAPGEELVLALDTIQAADVEVELTWRGRGQPIEASARLGEGLGEGLDGASRNAFVLGPDVSATTPGAGTWGWNPARAASLELTGLVVWHHGERRDDDAPEADAETLRQLRALGYVQ